ncbi:MAG TPA: protocatechuate 3,4-dioxygenase subunit alpha [Pelagibacterium sp.]|uniref:protocatechuate 3,4-dioxygenase subunit alpha n=1 Tax=Pelagibacterium sp. TaxID=1967288 RepID=UPI002B68EF99|nr:protocatechuate 3,4-dioxygenase subunit alpha [Pelagibacterium sp.]HWJ87209.1 protocatechuate 3,4-dioxygenase subunit alpha [Pelagibacterium sp.]
MTRPIEYLKETASQTAGPYVHIGMTPNEYDITGVIAEDPGVTVISDGVKGERITVQGRVLDGAGKPVFDCVVEIWQADANGIYNSPAEHRAGVDPNFSGWGRQAAGENGEFSFETIKPGPVPAPGGGFMAPHITFWIVARGINLGLQTRMYFSDEDAANKGDPILAKARMVGRDHTMIGSREGSTVTFDIHLQGESETVFLDI